MHVVVESAHIAADRDIARVADRVDDFGLGEKAGDEPDEFVVAQRFVDDALRAIG